MTDNTCDEDHDDVAVDTWRNSCCGCELYAAVADTILLFACLIMLKARSASQSASGFDRQTAAGNHKVTKSLSH